MNRLLLLLTTLLLSLLSFSQTGLSTLRGTVREKSSGEDLPFAKVILYRNDSIMVAGCNSDFDGKYIINSVSAGEYTLRVSYVGYEPVVIKQVKLTADKITFIDIEMESGVMLEEVQIVSYKQHNVNASRVITRQDISRMPTRSMRKASRAATVNHNTESYNHIQDNEFVAVKNDPLSTFSIDVDRASYSNIRRHINDGSLPPKDAVRIEEMINYFSYDYPTPTGKNPFSITSEYTYCPWNFDHRLVHIGLKGKEIDLDNAPANNLVFLIDVSGSMNSPDKLDLLKSGMYLLVDQLREIDKVAIVVYAGAAGLVLPSTSGEKKDQIKSVIEQLNAGGSTAGGAGIKLAYKTATENFIQNGNNRVILASDGDFNVGISSEGGLVRLVEEKRESGVFLSVLGFGRGNLKDSHMERIADKGNGNYNYIDNILEAKKVLVDELGGTLVTIAKDVKIQTEFNPNHVKAYRLIGYVNRQLDDEDFNDDKKDAGELGSGHTVTVLYEIIPAGSKEKVPTVDPLKYQSEEKTAKSSKNNDEVLTVKFRYKKPKEIKSKLIEEVLMDKNTPFAESSENCQFAAAVSAFGMLLRDSEFKGDINYKRVAQLAKDLKGDDKNGYRAEFIRLVEMAAVLHHK